jgi:peptidoglycan/xylan/chitin deacetylase (PgdA/CDA1 family)
MNSKLISSRALALLAPTNLKLPPPIYKVPGLGNVGAFGDKKNPICLTFDDGPDPAYTQKILDILADYNVKATFFVLGKAAEQFPNLLEQMASAGHSIGNHSYSHDHPWLMTSDRAKHEVAYTTDIIKKITGNAPRWFRPPFGRLRTAMRKQAYSENMATVLWSHSIIDWGLLGTEAGISNRLQHIEPNDIVLMHDGKREHNHPDILVRCLPEFLRSLEGRSLIACNLDGVS